MRAETITGLQVFIVAQQSSVKLGRLSAEFIFKEMPQKRAEKVHTTHFKA